MPQQTDLGELLTAEVEKKAQNDEPKIKVPEVHVVSMQDIAGARTEAGIPQTPLRQ
jgi:hypothetical protein